MDAAFREISLKESGVHSTTSSSFKRPSKLLTPKQTLQSSRSIAQTKSSSSSRRQSILQSTGASAQDARFVIDSRAALKAFRLIGGFDGIELEELLHAASKVRNDTVRIPLEKSLVELFKQYDSDDDGILDVLGFEAMLMGSTSLAQAVYELLERAEEEEQNEFMEDADYIQDRSQRIVDLAAAFSSFLNIIILACQTDINTHWKGWQIIEMCFLSLFCIEFFVRIDLVVQHAQRRGGSFKTQALDAFRFCIGPMSLFELAIITVGWIDVLIFFFNSHDSSQSFAGKFRWIRVLRVGRCVRLIRVFWYCQELRVLIAGILTGLRAAMWGFALLILIVLVWAVAIRTAVTTNWEDDNRVDVLEAFPNTFDSMLLVFRCMALRADGACGPGKIHGSVYDILSGQFGWAFKILWTVSEAFVFICLLNVFTSIYVVQAAENAKQVQEDVNQAMYMQDQVRLQSLDKLLRTLIHPAREQSNPKDRNAAEVAKIIRSEHPEAAAKIPNLESQIVHFAKSIQECKRVHQSAVDIYEAEEVVQCKQLRDIPCAKTFMVDGVERLLVEDDASLSNSLGLPMAPMGAVEVTLVQSLESCEELLAEAKEVQQFVKSLILPNSSWAEELGVGSSGQIWKQSKGLCDEAIDPGLKNKDRIEKKVSVKYKGRYERNRDYCRLALIYNSVEHMIQAIPRFLEYSLNIEGAQVVYLENRFLHPHPLGWRDITMFLKVQVPCKWEDNLKVTSRMSDGFASLKRMSFVATLSSKAASSEALASDGFHIMELQLRLKRLAEVCHTGHKFYEEIRANLPEVLVSTILDRLVTDTTLDLGITKAEWLQCLPNKEVKKLLDALQIPKRTRKSLFDLIDIDGSGTVTSSELQETLRLFKAPAQAPELAGCHCRVRDIQSLLRNKLEPELSMMHKHMERVLSTTEQMWHDVSLKLDLDGVSPQRHSLRSPRQSLQGNSKKVLLL